MARNLLLEIGTEEMPARVIPLALQQLQAAATDIFASQRIACQEWQVYGTPRRLALIGRDVAETQSEQITEIKGPSLKIAFTAAGEPTKAARGFARSQGVEVADLVQRDGYVYARRREEGRPVSVVLSEILPQLITSINFPKSMRWGDLEVQFVRPIRWLVALFGSQVIPFTIGDVTADRVTRGHRYLGSQHIVLASADDYLSALKENCVVIDQKERESLIRQQVREEAARYGGQAEIDPELLAEVVYLVEYPTAVTGRFDPQFLQLPAPVVITPMRDHQRYFPVVKPDGGLLPLFITVRNGNDAFLENVRHGNERVLRARLADAQFFFAEDVKTPLAARLDKLRTIVFQEGLGTLYDKTQRLVKLAEVITAALETGDETAATAKRAALLAKADLTTNMVYEFPELQGVMGREYARRSGENPAVAQAIFEHYLPRHAGDDLPATPAGRIVSIADKIDNITATFSRGLVPSGSQDPFALRRQALGIINILIDGGYNLSLSRLTAAALDLLPVSDQARAALLDQVTDFFRQRLKSVLTDQGIRYDIVDAVLGVESDDVYDVYRRAMAMATAASQPFFPALVQALTRVGNLARQAQEKGDIESTLFTTPQEQRLYAVYTAVRDEMSSLIDQGGDYSAALAALTKLNGPVADFFDAVMVMVDDDAIRTNRLALLQHIRDLARRIADFSQVVIP